jgi:SCP-2 sterol transfer family
MAEWPNEEWAEAFAATTAGLPEVSGASGTVALKFTGGTRKEIAVHWTYRDGVPEAGTVGAAAEPDIEFTLAAADASDVISGAVEPSVAFMRGRLKASGHGDLLLAFLQSTTSETFAAWRGKVAAATPS